MGLWQKITGELIDIVEWTDSSNDTLVWRFERYNNEIKHGAKLIVRESQAAVFVNQGQFADTFLPGIYELKTDNLPILSTLQGWKYGFESPFKAEVYFVATRIFTNLPWGTKNPIMLRDPEFGPIRLRAFGNYTMRVTDPQAFLKNVAGTDEHFTVDEISEQLRNLVVSKFAEAVAELHVPALDLAQNYDEVSKGITGKMATAFADYGIEVRELLIENISLPPEVEAALDKRSSMSVLGNMQQYTAYQVAESIPLAAQNPGGLAGAGLGLGAGVAMGQQVAGAMSAPSPSAGPPPLPGAELAVWHVALGGTQAGPFQLSVIQQKIATGEVTRETLAWKPGMGAWTMAGQIAELATLFAQVPPPLP
ncbi:MAG: SPFH domain-containing protein, partial [bacterium]